VVYVFIAFEGTDESR